MVCTGFVNNKSALVKTFNQSVSKAFKLLQF